MNNLSDFFSRLLFLRDFCVQTIFNDIAYDIIWGIEYSNQCYIIWVSIIRKNYKLFLYFSYFQSLLKRLLFNIFDVFV